MKTSEDNVNFSTDFTARSSITEGGISLSKPREMKGGVFAPSDYEVIKRALYAYKDVLLQTEESERNPSPDLVQVSNLLHRIGRVT